MVEQVVVVVVVVVVVEVALLFAEWPAAAVGIAARQASACSATVRCYAPGLDASAAPSCAGSPSAAVGGVAPDAVCSVATGSPG